MQYVYPAVFTPSDDGYSVSVPDLPGCHTQGDTLAEAIEMAEDAISMWLWHAEGEKWNIPPPSDTLPHEPPQFINPVRVDTDEYRRQRSNATLRAAMKEAEAMLADPHLKTYATVEEMHAAMDAEGEDV